MTERARRLHNREIARARAFLARAQTQWTNHRVVEARGYVKAALDTLQALYTDLSPTP